MRLDIQLVVGQVAETVEVVEAASQLSSDSAAVGTVIDQKRILELPLNGRNWLKMVALRPNVSAEQRASGHVDSRQGGERGRQSISVAGQRQFFNRYTLDGVENTDVNYNTYVARPSIEAVREFKVGRESTRPSMAAPPRKSMRPPAAARTISTALFFISCGTIN